MLQFQAVPDKVRDLLSALSSLPALEHFALGGGTSLALRLGHRLSVDLDFFTTSVFETGQLALQLGIPGAVETNRAANSLTLAAGGVKVDFLRHAYPMLAPPDVIGGVTLLSLPDVIAMKLNAIANRGAKKDFFDVLELQKHTPLAAMINHFEQKYQSADRFTVIRSLAWHEDAELEPDPVSLNGTTWQEVRAGIRSAVAALV